MADNDPEVTHYDSTMVKRDKDGNIVMSDHVIAGQEEALSLDDQRREEQLDEAADMRAQAAEQPQTEAEPGA